jgi:hypothetical protein
MSYRYSDDIGEGNIKMRVRFVHTEEGPKHIAFLIDGDWIDVTPNTYYEENTDAWFMEWELPEDDVEEDGYYTFQMSYSADEPQVWFYIGDDVCVLTDNHEKQRIRGNVYRVINKDDEVVEVTEEDD